MYSGARPESAWQRLVERGVGQVIRPRITCVIPSSMSSPPMRGGTSREPSGRSSVAVRSRSKRTAPRSSYA